MCRCPPHGRSSHVIGGNSLLGVGGPIGRWALLIAALVTALAVVTVPPSTAQAQQPCDNGVAVPNPSANSGLVADCNTLLSLKDTLTGTATLNWRENTAIANWDGIAVGGSPQRVTELDLSSHALTGTIPTELGEVASLQKLRLSGNALTGPIPSDIGDLVNLEGLWLSTNQLTGTIPRELGNLGNMQDMSLTNNQLTGSIPPELGNLVNLEVLHLFGNQLTGSIPSQLGSLVNLRSLWLNANQLTGSIPKELGNLVNLEQLVLLNNALTGSIPSELGSLVNLQILRLDRNQFTGSTPIELGNLVNLQILRLDRNQLTGSTPLELLSLTDLKQLQLHNNELTGSIPSELGNLTTLEGLWLSNNLSNARNYVPVDREIARNYRPLRQVIDHPVRRNGDHCCSLDVRSSDGVQGGVESGDSRSGAALAVRHQPAAYINWYGAVASDSAQVHRGDHGGGAGPGRSCSE